MVNSWPIVKFGTLYNEPSRNGLTKPKRVRGEGVKFINMGEIFKFDRMDNIPCDRVPVTDKEKSASLMKEGDLLFARQSLILSGAGKCSIFLGDKEEVVFESHLIRVRLNTDVINPEYAYYYFNSPQGRANISTIVEQGAGQAGIRGSDLQKLEFPLPQKKYQDYIVSNVCILDLKLELNHQTNQTLEQMAQTLFKSWFVDFDPVFDNLLAKANYQLANLPADFPEELHPKAVKRLAALSARIPTQEHENERLASGNDSDNAPLPHPDFPSEFEFNEQLGWVPLGWEVKSVSEAIKVNPRTTLSKGSIATFADMKAIPTSGYMVDEVIEKEYKGGAKFKKNDVLFARITPCLQNGKTALVDFLSDNEVGFGSTEFIVFREGHKINYPYIACLAREENFRAHCMQSMVGSSGRQRVQNACFDDYYLAIPNEIDVLDKFTKLTSVNFTKMTNNKLENQSLTKLRDTLLPKLISGEIEIPSKMESII